MDRERLKKHFEAIAQRATEALSVVDSMTRYDVEGALTAIDTNSMLINELLDEWELSPASH
jgi:hypothetical protein